MRKRQKEKRAVLIRDCAPGEEESRRAVLIRDCVCTWGRGDFFRQKVILWSVLWDCSAFSWLEARCPPCPAPFHIFSSSKPGLHQAAGAELSFTAGPSLCSTDACNFMVLLYVCRLAVLMMRDLCKIKLYLNGVNVNIFPVRVKW